MPDEKLKVKCEKLTRMWPKLRERERKKKLSAWLNQQQRLSESESLQLSFEFCTVLLTIRFLRKRGRKKMVYSRWSSSSLLNSRRLHDATLQVAESERERKRERERERERERKREEERKRKNFSLEFSRTGDWKQVAGLCGSTSIKETSIAICTLAGSCSSSTLASPVQRLIRLLVFASRKRRKRETRKNFSSLSLSPSVSVSLSHSYTSYNTSIQLTRQRYFCVPESSTSCCSGEKFTYLLQ